MKTTKPIARTRIDEAVTLVVEPTAFIPIKSDPRLATLERTKLTATTARFAAVAKPVLKKGRGTPSIYGTTKSASPRS